MDPQRAQLIFTEAGLASVTLNGKRYFLNDTSEEQLRQIKSSRGPSLAFARTYVRAVEAVHELEKACALLGQDLTAMRDNVSFAATKPKTNDDDSKPAASLKAIVPYVPTIAADPVAKAGFRPSAWLRDLLAFYEASYVTAAYKHIWNWSLKLLIYLPLILMWIVLLLLALLGLRILNEPELIIQAAFYMLRSIPSYSTWAAERMLQQVQTELHNFLR